MPSASAPVTVEPVQAADDILPASLLQSLFSTTSLFCCVLAAIIYLWIPRTFADPDIWWHLRDAEILIHTHHFLTRDLFSFTAAGAPWMNHEWLAELPFYAAWHLGGTAGVHAFTVLLIELIMFGVFGLALRRSRNLTLSLVLTVIGTLLATVSFGPRTLLFGWLCLLLELAVLELSKSRPALLWCLPALFAIWVNTHGSWMIGLVILGLFILGRAIRFELPLLTSPGLAPNGLRRLGFIATSCVAALFLNPYGWRLVAYPFNLAYHQTLNVANVEEWHTLDLHTPRGKLALACVLALAVWQLVRPRRWALVDLLLVVLGIYSGFTYSRFLFLFTILAVPAVATMLSNGTVQAKRTPQNRTLLNALCMLLLLVSVVRLHRQAAAAGPDLRAGQPLPEGFPPALAHLPQDARVFNDYAWGGLLIWQQHQIPVFIDSRVDIFEYNGTLKDYLDIVHLQDTDRLLDQHRITHVLFEADAPLVYFLKRSGGWDVVAQQGNVILLQRHLKPVCAPHAANA